MGDFEEDVLDPNDEWEDEKYSKPEAKGADDDDEEKGGPSLSPPMISRQFSYDIMSMAEIEEKQVEMTASISEQFDIPDAEAGILLRFYQWNMNKLIDEWVADSAKVRTKCGISETDASSPKISPDSPFTCPLCADDVKYTESDALACGHRYCASCWQSWLEAESDKGASAVFTVCIAEGCKECVTDKLMLKYLSPDKKAKYKLWVIEGLVLGSKSMRWCPAPKCDRIVEYKTGGAQEIHCKCGMVFCFKCGQQGHRPVVCDVVATWLLKNSTDSENVNWIIANTKKCPKCGVAIEKNQGCNHMTCGTCRHEFCWLCKGPWSDHGSATGGYYKCNKYEADKGAVAFAEEAKAEEAKNALNKYIHYFTRFDNHDKSIRFAVETRRKAEIVMAKLQDKLGTNYSDVQFVLNAVNAVVECRRVLKWSYVYGYYLEGELEKRIFENHQERLEKFTEALHGLSEKPLEDLLETSMRTQIVNYTRVIEKYRENILAAIESGLKS